MNELLLAVIGIGVAGLLLAVGMPVAGILAVRQVYGVGWRAALGLKCEARCTGSIWYVSQSWHTPIPVYWCGSNSLTEQRLAKAMADGRIPTEDFTDAVSSYESAIAACRGVRIWPTSQIRDLLGSPDDLAADKPEEIDRATALLFSINAASTLANLARRV